MTSPLEEQTEVTPKRFGELVAQSIADIQTLVRNQIDLAVAELKESGRRALRSSVFLITALGFFAISGLLLIIALAFGLTELGIPTWLAFVIDAGIFMLIAIILLLLAKSNAKKVKAPSKSMDSVEKTINDLTAAVTRTDPNQTNPGKNS